ncbi:hypothetical protein HELRODRAFT_157808 [Helobdella robusta]|uniref:Ferlin C-terminal domain-containing protein n=1 Tax=Helobdella robusta TaxID=6412 RepID=T1EMG2_HELRO|nr:hypothetical protein HELRODRAFT_157808 [Helobdella robusta]ESN93713.1 hypothetical protein HELRODRAFT_157808 [Helobdella robusta]
MGGIAGRIPGGWPLVPEHVETRPLYCETRPGIEQGRLELWIDMFPRDSPKLPACIDISPRQPKTYELRCIVWNTDEVTLDDVNALTGEASSDIFVKGFLKAVGVDDLKTDIHYRSLTGEGNFNWRFIFRFDYLKAENKVVYMKKDHVLSTDMVEHKTPPNLSIQVWDADLVTADDFLGLSARPTFQTNAGSIVLNLLKIPRPAKKVEKCSLKMVEAGTKHPTLNLFKSKRCKGCRPDTSFLWFMNPLKTLKYIIWKNYKWLIIKLIILLIFVIFLVLFFYNFPGAVVDRIVNKV